MKSDLGRVSKCEQDVSEFGDWWHIELSVTSSGYFLHPSPEYGKRLSSNQLARRS
jgi:hypothetical protein